MSIVLVTGCVIGRQSVDLTALIHCGIMSLAGTSEQESHGEPMGFLRHIPVIRCAGQVMTGDGMRRLRFAGDETM
jgi:hypothetical protein